MRVAVIQCSMRVDQAGGPGTLLRLVAEAATLGAGLVVVSRISPDSGSKIEAAAAGATLLAARSDRDLPADGSALVVAAVGRVSVLAGDSVIDPRRLEHVASEGPDILVLSPGSESDLQAEAVLELALDLSVSVASLVLVVDEDGAEPGQPGHGGSAIVYLGQVMAEATEPCELLVHDVDLPLTPPEPRGPLPEVSPLLLQRLAAHRGVRLDVTYPADLS